MVLYLVSVFGYTALKKAGLLAPPFSFGLALLPGLCVVWFMWGHYRYVQECDELQRKVQMDALVFAAFTALGLSTSWGLAELFADVPKIGIFWVHPLFYAAFALGGIIFSRRYGVKFPL